MGECNGDDPSTMISTKNLVFAVNGERFEVPTIHPSTTLAEFLRSSTRFKSVKLGCGEGGCGSCVVLVSKYDPLSDQVEDYTVNSCLTLLCNVNGCSITTAEGIGNSKDGFHPIHERFAGFHASQCGFCTPGMCMSLYSALLNADKMKPQEPSSGFSNLTVAEAERSVAGNLCRCTGYRPIADACKSFAANVDIEDLGLNSFWRKEDSKQVKQSKLPPYNFKDQICRFPEFLKEELKYTATLDLKGCSWYSPTSIKELQGLLTLIESVKDRARVKLVVSNTGVSYYKELEKYDKYIDLKYIPELSVIRIDESGMQIGAAVTLSKAIDSLKEASINKCNGGTGLLLRKIANHLEKVATLSVRNSGSIGGNLVMSQRNGFPSDVATVLLAVNATVYIATGSEPEMITFEKFLTSPPLDSRALLVSIHIPSWKPVSKDHSGQPPKLLFETYRAAPRPLGNALAYLNAAFMAEVSPSKDLDAVVIRDIYLAFGAYGTAHAVRARKVEEFLVGKTLRYDALYEAVKLTEGSIVPEDGIRHASYRSSLAAGYLFEFLHPLIVSRQHLSPLMSNGIDQIHDEPSIFLPAKQAIVSSGKSRSVGDTLVKAEAALQASGEAVYVDDIPSPPDCLYGAFIYSTMPLAKIKGVKFESGSYPDGVFAIISFRDIPNGGANIGCQVPFFKPEPLFAEDLATCAGDRIALVVAVTQKQADLAAQLAVVEYDTEGLDPPILTVEEAVERSSFFELTPFAEIKQVGDFSKGMAEADHKILSEEIRLPSQYFFYMEPQTALVVPDEDNCMVVYSSNQIPEYCTSTISRCLGIPEHNVRVITRRAGGGFGGKAFKSMLVAAACAVAAHKLRRPVRMYLNRKSDMIMAGGRHPMKITYSVGFKSDGKITALHLDGLLDAGNVEDYSPFIPWSMVNTVRKYNWGALSSDFKVCKTNNISRTAMRAPGELQGSYIAEAVIEHVAASLSMDVDAVRAKNLHSFESISFFYGGSAGEAHDYTLPSIWDKLSESSSYTKRAQIVEEFNNSHEWKKRGISKLPIVTEMSRRATPGRVSILWDGSIVVEVGGVEIGQGLYTKVKQMAAFGLSLIECDGAEDLVDRVRVVQADTLSLVQGGMTAASTTSEANCEAVRLCCSVLVERLKPLKENLQKQSGSVDWKSLIFQAELQSVNLSASSYYVPESNSIQYLTYGAAVSEVEVNLMTGETTVLRSDLVYDCGQSLNPAVDLGQIEGAFVQGIGFFMMEEYLTDSNGRLITDSTWSYKIPTMDTVPRQFNVEILNSKHNQKHVLSSKASGEPPLLLAATVHCATRAAIKEARKQLRSWGVSGTDSQDIFKVSVPATMPVVKELCGLDIVDKYLHYKMACGSQDVKKNYMNGKV